MRDADQSGSKTGRTRLYLGSGLAGSAFGLRPSHAERGRSDDLIDYYLDRNAVTHESHRKSWLAKHKELAEKLLL